MKLRLASRCVALLFFQILIFGALAAENEPSVEVRTASLRQLQLDDAVHAYGTVATSEEAMVDISFPHPGQIGELKVRSGQTVKTGEQLVTISADPAALQSYQKALATLEFAKRELGRQQTLRSQHLATNAEVAAAQKAVDDATLALETERKLGNDKTINSATAPFDGFVAQIMAAPGDRLQANAAILKLARTDQPLRVAAGVKPQDAGRIASGMAAEIVPILIPESKPLEGIVRQLGGTINPTTRLAEAWIELKQGADLMPGASVAVKIILSRHEGWVVPRNAVLHDEKGTYIFQVSGGHAKRVDVNTGIETDQLSEVLGSFDPLLEVVISGNYELRDGMAVRAASAAAP